MPTWTENHLGATALWQPLVALHPAGSWSPSGHCHSRWRCGRKTEVGRSDTSEQIWSLFLFNGFITNICMIWDLGETMYAIMNKIGFIFGDYSTKFGPFVLIRRRSERIIDLQFYLFYFYILPHILTPRTGRQIRDLILRSLIVFIAKTLIIHSFLNAMSELKPKF